jgi:phage shock protein E
MELSQSALTRHLTRTLPAVGLGALAGYAYYYFIGCTSGTCPITSNPWISTVYGAAMGGLLVPWKRSPKERDEARQNTEGNNE